MKKTLKCEGNEYRVTGFAEGACEVAKVLSLSASVRYVNGRIVEVTVTDEPELKPCPFCGGAASCEMASNHIGVGFSVSCIRCMADTDVHPSERLAIEAWNRRDG